MATIQFSHILYHVILALAIWQLVQGMPTATLVLDTTEAIENNIPTAETTNFQQTTDNNVTSIQQVKERPVGRDSYSSDSSSDSNNFSGGVIAGIAVGVIGGIFFCCCCLFILGKLCS